MIFEEMKLARLKWVVDLAVKAGSGFIFVDMRYWIHIDEKWFYTARDGEKFCTLLDEAPLAALRMQSKHFINNVMFLEAMGRPHERRKRCWFTGLAGIWPFVEKVIAQRTGKKGGNDTFLQQIL